jgi:hypothetical protein
VFFLVYVSAAETWFSATELHDLLRLSRERNVQNGITGLLLYKDGNFMQALEGEEPAVRKLHQRICGDRRHHGLVVLDSGTTPERQFAQWSMGFFDLGLQGAARPEGYSAFMDLPLADPLFKAEPSRCMQLLRLFKQID